ncbi:MAG TPA: DNA-processing protein DprA, partial [Candidatus Saccharimonadales bacterium]|nr:DNA-processing protein DprA [Candidatus Saccharimonadales bacterium]
LSHKTALESKTRTIAVLGSGVDQIYPPQNEGLAKEIAENGAVISEYPPGMIALPGNFPARNRIISGLSLGVLVTEAGVDSGSLITAGLALEQNREVFAVPGPIYSQLSKGPSSLIKQGAKLVTTAEDVLEELNIKGKINKLNKEIIGENKEEILLIKLLENEEKHIDQLIRESKFTTEKLNSLLMTMEISGKIKNLGGGNYSLNY